MSRFIIIGTVVAVVAGCAGGFKPIKRKDHFPKPEELQQIDQQPAPTKVFEQMDQVRLAQWQLTGPFPEVIGVVPREPVDELDRIAAAEAQARGGVATEAMRCVAREVGKIHLAYGKQPELALKRFIQHRCGSVSSHVSMAWVSWEQDELTWAEADEDGAASTSVREQIAALTEGRKDTEIGAWYGFSDGRAVAMTAVGQRLVDLDPLPSAKLNGGTFDLRGSLLDPSVDVVTAVVNHGLYDWEQCHALPEKLPRFHLRCQANPSDVEAGFEIYVRRRGDLLASAVLWQRVWPAGNAPARYVLHATPEVVAEEPQPVAVLHGSFDGPAPGEQSAADGEPEAVATPTGEPDQQPAKGPEPTEPGQAVATVETAAPEAEALPQPLEPEPFDTSATALRTTILDLVNEARARGKLQPVALAEKQSASAGSLAPHFWEAARNDDSDTTNQIMYGLLAGWEVVGPIIDGTFFSGSVHGGPHDLVNEFIARPGARSVVFGPEIEKLAIGVHYEPESQTLGGIVHGWEFVPDESHTKRVNRFLDFIAEARKARGNSKPKKVVSLNGYTLELSKKLAAQELELHQVAKKLLDAFAAANAGKQVMVFYVETHDPTTIEIPDAVLNVAPLQVALVVAPYKPPKSPWNVYGVVFAYVAHKSPTKIAAK